jgi:hypothetical protein
MPPNNAFHLTRGLAFARPPAGECERWAAGGTTPVHGGVGEGLEGANSCPSD